MKKIVTAVLLLLIMFLLQTSVFSQLSYGRIVPNLLILLTSTYGLIRGEYSGIFLGFFSGLLLDIFFMDVLGFYALVYMLIGYFDGKLNTYYIHDDFKLPLAVIAGSNVLVLLVDYVFFNLLNGNFDFGGYILHTILPELIYTLGISVVLYPLLVVLEYKFVLAEFRRDDSDVI
ncbi:MAG: rod shape-determining protein MreD [Lachnospiraceae bacterium]|nr:rod shape-determining protein MreD [Lachnospiraceae bacterium]